MEPLTNAEYIEKLSTSLAELALIRHEKEFWNTDNYPSHTRKFAGCQDPWCEEVHELLTNTVYTQY